MMQSAAIRQAFLNFFESRQHLIVPSAPIVIKNDPTLLFTNAGMNQFKDYFLGNKVPPSPRVADTQKCLRVSGKHNDLEEVGVDTYHHTMFEMLGNWSFGNPAAPEQGYFKKEAIEWSWQLLTEIYKIPKENLYVTVFEGDEKEGLPKDEEAWNEWKKYVDEDHILLGNKKDNFWEMGDTGPCGPCTEIHADCRTPEEKAEVNGATLINKDHPQVIEIWNNVFIQFNRKKNGDLELLPAKHVDTGMGFERLVRVLQNKKSNYDTDIFQDTIVETEKLTGKKYSASDDKESVAFRVLADHIRAIAFTIADGQLPSNTGAGYVVRRILRRAVRYYYSYLNYKHPLLHQLLPVTANKFEDVFPELKLQLEFISKVIKEEEESFLRTLDKGLKRMDIIIASAHETINGNDAFELLDTYGFPIDLTQLIAQENSLQVDMEAFAAEMKMQKERSRAATSSDAGDWIIVNNSSHNSFVGYTDLLVETKVIKYRSVKSKNKEQFQIVLKETPFYAESGGQVGDKGILQFDEEKINIVDTKKENDLIVHFVDKLPEDISSKVIASVNWESRINTSYNHTATHLLHAALKSVLGNHVNQKGSLVSADVLRFDFSHFAKVTDDELREITTLVNNKIRENIAVEINELSKAEALELGAMALFGEKYGDLVRVVIIDPKYSIELCGGTHLANTGMIGAFVITSESAVAAGVRRIEALTGGAAIRYFTEKVSQYNLVNELLKTKDPIKSIAKILEDRSQLEKRIESLEARQLVGIRNELLTKDKIINNITFIGDIVEVPHADALKKLSIDLTNHLHDNFIVLCANIGGKAQVAISISETVVAAKNLDATKLIKEIVSPLIAGGGGGQKTFASAGGQNASNFNEIILKLEETLKNLPQ